MKRMHLVPGVLAAVLLAGCHQASEERKLQRPAQEVTAADKRVFLELLNTLPLRGEFFTDGAIARAAPYTPVLFALTEEDIKGYDLYPFLALSGGLLDRREQREYGVQHFSEISHPTIKLEWAIVLFNQKAASAEIRRYLQAALKSSEQSKTLAEMLGPDFEDFKRRLAGGE